MSDAIKISRAGNCSAMMVDDELVMMSIELGQYFALNQAGARVWELLETPRTLADLCTAMEAEYDVKREVCHREVAALLEELKGKGLVTFVANESLKIQ
jgi:hypothetical protein